MDPNHPRNLAEFTYIKIIKTFNDLYNTANAKDIINPSASTFAKAVAIVYRHILVIGWIASMLLIFYAGAVFLTREILKADVLPSTIESNVGVIESEKEGCICIEATKLPSDVENTDPMPIHRSIFNRVIHNFPHFLRSSLLGLSYYALHLAFLISFDAILNLQTALLRSLAFVYITALLSPLHMLWTYTLSSNDRVSCQTIRKVFSGYHYAVLLLPSLAHAGSQVLIVVTPFVVDPWVPRAEHSGWYDDLFTYEQILIIGAAVLVFIFVQIPTMVLLTRVEVALMGGDDRSIRFEVCEKHSPGIVILVGAVRSLQVDCWVVQRVLKVDCCVAGAVLANLLILLFF